METCIKVLRKSNNDPEEIPNQQIVIDPFVEQRGWKCLDTITLLDLPRWNMKPKVRELIFEKVKKLRPNWLVYRDHDRIGFHGTGQLGWYLEELADLGVKVILAKDGRVMDMQDSLTSIQIMADQIASKKEIEDKSYRTTVGRKMTISRRSSAGGRCPYGYDWLVIGRDGKEKYREVYEGYEVCEGTRPSKIRGVEYQRKNLALCRAKIFPDGRREEYRDHWTLDPETQQWHKIRNCPSLDKGDRKITVPNPERAEVVKEIFRLADTPHWNTSREIADELNSRGILPTRFVWKSKTVLDMLRNPIYKGYPLDCKKSHTKCKEKNKPVEIPLTEEERAVIRLVSVEQWQRVNEHLDGMPKRRSRKRNSNLSHFWARSFLMCGTCQQSFYLRNRTSWSCSEAYYCPRCEKRQVPSKVIHAIIDQWLQWLEQNYSTHTQPDPNRVIMELVAMLPHVGSIIGIEYKMARFILDCMPGETDHEKMEAYQTRPWKYWTEGPIWLKKPELKVNDDYAAVLTYQLMEHTEQKRFINDWIAEGKTSLTPDTRNPWVSIYSECWEEATRPVQDKIDSLDKELDSLFNLALTSVELRVRCDSRAKELEAEKRALAAQLNSLLPEYRAALQRAEQTRQHLAALHGEIKEAQDENKSVLLAPHLDRVVLHFDPNGRAKRECKLTRVEVHAVDPAIPVRVLDSEECLAIYRKHSNRGKVKKSRPVSPP